jgi:MGT family glycosyltransferase
MYTHTGGPGGHVAVFAFPDYGHVKPLLGLTRSLAERGHRVTWITDRRYAEPIARAGGALIGFDSRRPDFGAGPVVSAQEMGALGVAYLAESVRTILPLAEQALALDPPDLVLYDQETVLAARTLIDRWRRPGVQVFPCFASSPAYSLHDEVFDRGDAVVAETVALVQGFLTETGRDPGEIWTLLTPWAEHNLVLLPRALQPAGEAFGDAYTFVGHCVDPVQAAEASWSPPARAESIVLLSLGTEASNAEFFRTCVDAFRGRPHRHAVLTLGPKHAAAADMSEVPANVEPHAWLPHTAVLPYADVFVTHGGMGSIVEALYYGVPMVVVPHSPEPRINARRIAELGLGEVLPVGDLDAGTLAAAVARVAEDREMRRRVGRIRESVIADGGVPSAVRLIEGLLRTARPDRTVEDLERLLGRDLADETEELDGVVKV